MKQYTFLFFLCLSFLLLIFSYAFIDPNVEYMHVFFTGTYLTHRAVITFFYLFILIGLSGCYLVVLQKKDYSKHKVRKYIFLFGVALLFSYPAMLSYDIFNYILSAKILYHYKENPYILMPNVFVGDPYLIFTRATNKIALYGPSWLVFSGLPYVLSFENFIVTLLAFKIFIISFYYLTNFFIWKLSKNISSVMLFGFNPLVLIEVLVSGHNDIVMMGLVLGAFYFLKEKKIFLAVVFLLTAVFIKYATFLLIPLFLYCLYKHVKHETIQWQRVYLLAGFLMLLVFFFSQLREEIYPWYTVWFLPFFFLIPEKKTLLFFSIGISFGMLLTDIPYMFFGTYASPTPELKIILSVVPSLFFTMFGVLSKNIWLKKRFQFSW